MPLLDEKLGMSARLCLLKKASELALVTLLVVVAASGESQSLGQANKEAPTAKLQVILATDKQVYKLGEPIHVRVEISNAGEKDIFVGKEITRMAGWVTYLELILEDMDGNTSPYIFVHGLRVPLDLTEGLASILAKTWIPLAPGYFYATKIELSPESFQFLRKPGRYRLRGIYYSVGVDLRCSTLKEEIEKLPYAFWKGEIGTNSIWIEIVTPTKDN